MFWGVRLISLGWPIIGRGARVAGILVVVATLSAGCATKPPADDPEAVAAYNEANDPIEPMNRAIFSFNITLDQYFLRPVSWVYKETVPLVIRNIIGNFLDNLKTPVILANDVLQWEWERAGYTTIRGIMNSTFGFAGVADIATDMGIPRHTEDFGQTLAVYGLGSGPYLVLPFLGSSDPRDAFGTVVDIFIDPLTYANIPLEWSVGKAGMEVITLRTRNFDAIDELARSSLDYYAAVRSLFWQRRRDEINNGRTPPNDPFGDVNMDEPDEDISVPPDKPQAN